MLHHDDQLDRDERQGLQALLVREAERAAALISDLLAAAGTPDPEFRQQSENGSSIGWCDLIMVEPTTPAVLVSGWPSRAATPEHTEGDLSCEEPHGIGAMFRLVLPLEPRQEGSPLGNRTELVERPTSCAPHDDQGSSR